MAPVREALRGRARALDTGTLEIGGSVVRLQGVVGERGSMADRLDRLLRRREVVCEALNSADVHQCKIGEEDLSEIVLAGGGARVQQDAPADLLAAEEFARAARLGSGAEAGVRRDRLIRLSFTKQKPPTLIGFEASAAPTFWPYMQRAVVCVG